MNHSEYTAFEKRMEKQPDKNREELSSEEKKKALFLRQKQTLDLFLERGAISQSQYKYNKSLGDLREKMGMQDVE